MRLPILLLLLIQLANSYNILVYSSKFAHSHSNFVGSVADILVEAGHNVTTLIPILDPHGKDGTTKSNKIYLDLGKEIQDAHHASIGEHKIFFTTKYFDPIGTYFGGHAMADMFVGACKETLKNEELIERLKNEKFDVMMAESFDMCGMGLSHIIKPKSYIAILTGTLFGLQYDEFGVSPGLTYNPSSYMLRFDVHSWWDRLVNLYSEVLVRQFFVPGRTRVHELFTQKYGKNFPSWKEISSNAAYVFHNSEPLLDFGGPTSSRVIPIGGLGAKSPNKLDKYWEDVMSQRAQAVLISFGSVAPSVHLPNERKQAILEAVRHFPDTTFIWKYEEPEDEFATEAVKTLPNLVLSKWTPQNDLLNHPKLAAFISHGGMGSCMEVAQRAVPALFIPLFGDQPKNSWMMEYNGIGKAVSKFDMGNAELLIANLKDLLENKKYRENARKISAKLAAKPFSSRDLVIKYTEFAAEFGPSRALRPQSCDMSFIEYHNVDIIVLGIALAIIFVIITAKIACLLVKKLLRKVSPKEKSS